MKSMLKKFWNDEAGFVVTVEMILVATVLVIGLVAGLAQLRDAVNAELADTAAAFGSIDQSFSVGSVVYGDIGVSNQMGYVDELDVGPDQAVGVSSITSTGLAIVVAPATELIDGSATLE
jgi:Flp pilus assembly pilin Flp